MTDRFTDPDSIETLDDFKAAYQDLVDAVEPIEGNFQGVHARLGKLAERLDDVEDRLQTVEQTVDVMDATVAKPNQSKLTKVKDVLRYADEHGTGGPNGIVLKTGEVSAAASTSRDTALRLMDEIAANFEWANTKNPGGRKAKQLRLRVDGDAGELLADAADYYTGTEDATA